MGPRIGRHAAITDIHGSIEPHIMVFTVVTTEGVRGSKLGLSGASVEGGHTREVIAIISELLPDFHHVVQTNCTRNNNPAYNCQLLRV